MINLAPKSSDVRVVLIQSPMSVMYAALGEDSFFDLMIKNNANVTKMHGSIKIKQSVKLAKKLFLTASLALPEMTDQQFAQFVKIISFMIQVFAPSATMLTLTAFNVLKTELFVFSVKMEHT